MCVGPSASWRALFLRVRPRSAPHCLCPRLNRMSAGSVPIAFVPEVVYVSVCTQSGKSHLKRACQWLRPFST